MRLFGWFRRDRAALESAKRADTDAAEQLRLAREDLERARRRIESVRSGWPKTIENGRHTDAILRLDRDSLTERFWAAIERTRGA